MFLFSMNTLLSSSGRSTALIMIHLGSLRRHKWISVKCETHMKDSLSMTWCDCSFGMSMNHNWLRYLTTAGGCRDHLHQDKESPAAVCHLSEKANTFGESDPTRQRCLFHRFRLQECKQLPMHFNWGIKGNQINSGRSMMKFKFYYRLTSSRCHANIILGVFVWFGLFLTIDWLNRCYSSQALCFVKTGWGKALTWLTIHCSLCPWSLQGSTIAS